MQKTLSYTFCFPVTTYCKLLRSPLSAVSGLAKVEKVGNFCLEETRGQPWKLFLAEPNTAIATCVSCDFQMDKGIAKQFLKQYGNFNELIEKGLKFPETCDVGKIGVLKTPDRFVYYLLTRRKWWESGSCKAMEQCLKAMQEHCAENSINRIAIPRLGAQCDRVDWDQVRSLLINAFEYSSTHITAYTHR